MPHGVLLHQLTWLWYGAERLLCALCSAYVHVHALLRHHVVHVHGTCAADLWLWCHSPFLPGAAGSLCYHVFK